MNLAPTSSTTMSLIIGDCIAIALLELKGFKSSNFKNFHPGGNLGKDLKSVIRQENLIGVGSLGTFPNCFLKLGIS